MNRFIEFPIEIFSFAFQELKEKTTEFEKLKLEWDSKTNELIGTYMKKLADEKERALTVRKSLVSFFFY